MNPADHSVQRHDPFDAIVVGGGPAGATAGAFLAQKGRRVLLLEKERFPRYRIGESLMPYCYFTLERLGVIDKIKSSHFPRKHSVQFVSTRGAVSTPFYFFEHFNHEAATTWQVLRSEFDQVLLDNARQKGVEVREGTRAVETVDGQGAVTGVRALDGQGRKHEFRAPLTLDASGRDVFSMTRNRWKVRDPSLNKIAIWTYYRGARRDPGLDAGATTVAYLPRKGWFWYIPLPEDRVSVGIVAEKDYLYRNARDPEAIFQSEIGTNPWIRDHLAPGRQEGRYWVTGEYSYRSRYWAADGLVLVGDAFAFLDPVFSSGVFLALRGGELAAEAADRALASGDCSAARFDGYGKEITRGLEAMRKLVYAFYDQEFSFRAFIERFPQLRGDLTDCLIGNLFRDLQPLFDGVAEFAAPPEPLSHGQALIEAR